MPSSPTRLAWLRLSGTGAVAALGGGVAGALLSMLTLSHPPATVLVACFAPLPLMIAALGFGPLSGGLAVVAAMVFVALFDLQSGRLVFTASQTPATAALDAGIFLLSLGLPAVLLGVAARQRAPAVTTPQARPEERLLGRLAVIAAAFAASAVAAALTVTVVANGGFDAFDATLRAFYEKLATMLVDRGVYPTTVDKPLIARMMTLLTPPFASASAVFFYLGNLWLAGRIAQVSELLGAPWPDVPRHLRVPRFAAPLLAVLLGLSLMGGAVGFYARILSAALVAVLAIQGLAVLHAVSRGSSSRLPLLLLVYFTLFVFWPLSLLPWGLLGLLDTAFSFRDRQKPVVVRKK